MLYPLDDTIAAIASARGGGPRGIVRLSGPRVADCLASVLDDLPEGERAVAFARELRIGLASPLPADLYLWPEGRSYTGQSAAEIHTLGSPPLLEHLVETLCAAGARLAQPGEFTLRAFLSGRIDLTQAEGVLGVIDAVGSRQVDAALVQLAGGLAGSLRGLRETLLDLLAHLEAGFDFADEDLPFLDRYQLLSDLEQASKQIEQLAERMASRREAAELPRVVLAGPPNAGKSSLFNTLANDTSKSNLLNTLANDTSKSNLLNTLANDTGKSSLLNTLANDAGALVSSIPGTTRDYLSADLQLDGVRCRLIDTAGVNHETDSSSDAIDQTAQSLARRQAQEAAVVLFCFEKHEDLQAMQLQSTDGDSPLTLLVRTKGDQQSEQSTAPEAILTSARTGQGIAELEDRIREAVVEAALGEGDVVAATAVRCRESLRKAAAALHRAKALAESGEGEELVAAEMRAALDQLGHVVGAVYTDDLLDRVFSRFCIGK